MSANELAVQAPVPFDLGALGERMRAQGLGPVGRLAVEPLTGGQSNPTYRVLGAGRPYVLRKRPPGPLLPSAHAIDREFRVMRALRGTDVPVPEAVMYCDDASIVGTPFYLMEFLDGRVMLDPSIPGASNAERAAIYDEMNRDIAALHGVDPARVGLADFGRTGNYFERQIARWARQYQDSRTERIEAMERLMEWLPQRVPQDERTAVVHGDYRLDNLVFHPTQPRVLGVLDWELATCGYPLADFAYHCMAWHVPPQLWRGIGGLDLAALGIPSEAAYRRRYAERTGLQDAEHWNFCLAFNLFRMAAILQGIAKRAREGSAAAADAVEIGRKARPLADLAWAFAQR